MDILEPWKNIKNYFTSIVIKLFFCKCFRKMTRMDVKRKLSLLNTYESYWLMLPTEIQEYIVVFKKSQDIIEWEKRIQRRKLCKELEDYHKLTIAWGLGFISCKFYYCDCKWNDRRCSLGKKHCKIFGMYYD